jgi:sugar fermentation stimulation protein A
MRLPSVRQSGNLIKRYKRFLADISLENGKTMTVHCPNSGSMLGCSLPGSPVIISKSDNPKRKYAWTLEMIQNQDTWIGINTSLTNKLVHEALTNEVITAFGKILSIRPEIKVSDASRLDFLLETAGGQVYLEVKNCSMAEGNIALFPDSVTARGTRHLHELNRLREKGFDTAVLFCVQRADADSFSPAEDIDPVYAQTLKEVYNQGVRVLAYQARVDPEEVIITKQLPIFKG